MRSNELMSQPPAVLIGLDSLQGLQTARILARRGIPVIGIARDPHHYCCRTNVCSEIIYADTESDQLVQTLQELALRLEQKAVLFPCEDANVLLVSRHRQVLGYWYHVALPEPEIVETLIDKIRFATFAKEHDLPIPYTVSLDSRADVERAIETMRFPCIMKPPISAAPEWEHNTMAKAFKVSTPEDLRDLYAHFSRWSASFLLQEYIEGPETNHYTCNCYFDANSTPLVVFTTQKIRQWPPRTGQACLGVSCHNEIVADETVRMFQSVNYRGLGYAEMKKDARTGNYFFIEPNIGRPTGRSATAEAAGVELLYTMYCDAIGALIPSKPTGQPKRVTWIFLRQDLQSALFYWKQGELSLLDWWRSWRGRKTYALFSWRDPQPFLHDIIRVAGVLFSAKERRKRNYQQPIVEHAK